MEGPTGFPRLSLVLLLGLGLLALACYAEPVAIPTERPTAVPRVTILPTDGPIPTASPAPPAITPSPLPSMTPIASPIAGGTPSATCVDGWISATAAMPEFGEGIAILSGYMGVAGPWGVTDIRYFTGPDSPGIIEPRYDVVERWYIRAALVDDPAFRGRWLLEKRTEDILGVSAVASWESFEYESPDWTGFIGEGPPQNYLGLPGQWSGIPFDFVTGEGDGGQPGLPPEVVGCLAGDLIHR